MAFQRVTSVRWKVTINNVEYNSNSLTVTRGAYGSVGTFSATLSIQDADLNINTVAAGNGPGGRVTVNLLVSTDNGKTYTSLMTGDLDELEWEFDKDTISLKGRDFGGRLIESRIVLKNSQYVNQTPSVIATEFARDAGLTPDVQTIPNEQPIGYLGENNLAIRTATPITKWAMLVLMARLTGRIVTVTPGNPPGLFFGRVNLNKTPKVYTWGAAPGTPNVIPCRELRGEWRPFKNSTFQVFVLSYHPQRDEMHTASITVAGDTISYEAPVTVKAGMYKGAAAATARLQIGSLLADKPAYVYYMHGKTAQECQTNAEAISREIAKREFLMYATVDGDLTVGPLDPVQIHQPTGLQLISQNLPTSKVSIAPFKDRLFYTNSVEHVCNMREGFITRLSCWHLPPATEAPNVLSIPARATASGVPVE